MNEAENTENTEGAERPLIRRTFAAEVTQGDGRTIDVRLVPFGERIQHNDGLGGLPRGQMYEEEWMPGVFDHQLNAAHRVLANVEHEPGFGGIVGKGVALRSEADGYHLELRVLDGSDGDKLLQLVPDPLDSVSLEAKPVKSVRSESGVVQRVKAHLMGVAFTRFPAYQGAKVLAVREEAAPQLVDEAFLPLDMNPDLIERLKRSGMELPNRYMPHPAQSDTPAETGTSEDGTRQTDANTSLEDNTDGNTD